MSEYQERNIEALDGYGGLYSKHVSAMTTEGLSSKSCIAAELAYRDQKIQELEKQLAEKEVLKDIVYDEKLMVVDVVLEMREALQTIYSHYGEDERISGICDPLIKATQIY